MIDIKMEAKSIGCKVCQDHKFSKISQSRRVEDLETRKCCAICVETRERCCLDALPGRVHCKFHATSCFNKYIDYKKAEKLIDKNLLHSIRSNPKSINIIKTLKLLNLSESRKLYDQLNLSFSLRLQNRNECFSGDCSNPSHERILKNYKIFINELVDHIDDLSERKNFEIPSDYLIHPLLDPPEEDDEDLVPLTQNIEIGSLKLIEHIVENKLDPSRFLSWAVGSLLQKLDENEESEENVKLFTTLFSSGYPGANYIIDEYLVEDFKNQVDEIEKLNPSTSRSLIEEILMKQYLQKLSTIIPFII